HRQAVRQLDVGRGKVHARQCAVSLALHIGAQHSHRALARQQEAEQHGDRRGLAGAVAPQQRGGDAALDDEIDVVDGERLLEALREAGDTNYGLAHGARLWPKAPAPASAVTGMADARMLYSKWRLHLS